jgi:hypothetical protein
MGAGQSIASNYISSHTQVVSNIITTTTQTCSGNCINEAEFNIIVIGDIDESIVIGGEVNQLCNVSSECSVSSSTNSCISNQLSQAVSQAAEAISKGVGQGGNQVVSENLTYLLTQYTQEIYTAYTQYCMASAYSKTTYNYVQIGSAENLYFQPTVNQFGDLAIDCALESQTVSTSKTNLQNYISQIATSKSVGAITPAVIIAVVLCITVILSVTIKKIKPAALIFLILFLALVGTGLYFLIAYFASLPPWAPEPECEIPLEYREDESTCVFKRPEEEASLFTANGVPDYIVIPENICGFDGSYGSGPISETGTFIGCRSVLPVPNPDDPNEYDYWLPCINKNQYPEQEQITVVGKSYFINKYPAGLAFDAYSQRCICSTGWILGSDDYGPDFKPTYLNPNDGCICNPNLPTTKKTIDGVEYTICG